MLNNNSFKLFNNRELNKMYEHAGSEIRNTVPDNHQRHEAWLASCWVEGIFSIMMSEGYTLTIEKDNVIKTFKKG